MSIASSTRGSNSTLVVGVALAALGACAGVPATPDGGPAVGDPRCRALPEDCRAGLYHADCGGAEPPVLVCSPQDGSCRWYFGGCPIGAVPSDCPPSDVCCHATADGAWPYADWAGTPMATVEARSHLAAMSGQLVDARTPTGIDVVIDPSLGAPTRPGASCSPGTPLQICEQPVIVSRSARVIGASLVIRVVVFGTLADALMLEVVPVDGALHARAFVRYEDDAAPPGVPVSCSAFEDRLPGLTGTLRLSTADWTSPDAVHAALEASFDGHTFPFER